jgi:Secretion system C-terminal sorting domain
VSGGIYNNATWSLAGSPYIVTGDIVVFPGKTLTIEPGVEVRVQGNGYPVIPGVYIEIRGRIVAVGTANAPITFKADGVVTDPWSWAGITIKTAQGGDGDFNYVNISNAREGFNSDSYVTRAGITEFNNCNFSNNYIGAGPWYSARFLDCNFYGNGVAIQPMSSLSVQVQLLRCNFDSNEVAITYVYDTVTVDSCVFTNNNNPLVSFYTGSVRNSLFDGNDVAISGNGGIIEGCEFINNNFAVRNLSAGSVTNCVIRNNQLGVELGPGAILQNNEISNNLIGVKIYDNVPTFTGNRVCGNTQYNVSNEADKNVSLVGNCFCESDSTVAEALLYDGYDDITRGLFNYALYDSTCTNIVQLVSKVNIPTGISPVSNAPISVYPNPVRDVLQVRLPAGVGAGEIKLLNLQGQVLRAVAATALTRLDVADLPAGVYLLDFQGVDRQIVKWIKE